MVAKLAPNSAHLTRGTWSNISPGGDFFVPYLHKTGINLRPPPTPPYSFNAAWEQEFIMQACFVLFLRLIVGFIYAGSGRKGENHVVGLRFDASN